MMKEISIRDIAESPVSLINDQWALVTAGDSNSYNTMTVSWGSIGELWGKDTATIYIRPQRYTYEYLEKNDYFTISFYPQSMKDTLKLCGRVSGRDCDKAKEGGLTPVFDENAPYFKEAKLVLVCKKMAKSSFSPENFYDCDIMSNYPQNDFHYIYYGAIQKVLISE